MHFKKELDTTELLKWGIASLGAVIAFFLAQYTALQIEVAKIKKEALQEIVEYSPRARINYTNELQENRSTLQVRVYFVPKSKGELYIFPPALTIYDESGGVIPPDKYTAHDIGQFQGSFPPDEPYQITYNIELHESINLLPNKVKLEYTIQTANIDAHPMIWYSKELQNIPVIGSSEIATEDFVQSFYSKKLIYKENIYQKGSNPIWNDFWENPR